MATFTSDQIAKLDAISGSDKFLAPAENYGRVRTSVATINAPITDLAANSVILLTRLQSHATIKNIRVYSDDLDSATSLTFNLGLFWGGSNGSAGGTKGTPVKADAYASGSTAFQTANKTPVDLTYANRPLTAATNGIWQDAGLTKDTGGHFDIGITVTAGGGTVAAGEIVLVVEFVID